MMQKVLLTESSKNTLDPFNDFSLRKKIKLQQIIPANGSSSSHVSPSSQDRLVTLKRGIPDACLQYIALNDVSGTPSFRNIQYKIPCDNMKITESLWKKFKISLQQGIPDTFKVPHVTEPEKEENKNKNKNKNESKESHFQEEEELKERNRSQEEKIRETKPRKNSVNCRKKSCSEKKNERNSEKIDYKESDEFNERDRHSDVSQVFLPSRMEKPGFSNIQNCQPPSKVEKMMRGIIRRCKNTVKNISNKSPNDFNMNFVCYRCNYPCFRVCTAEKCLNTGEFIEKKPIIVNPHQNDVNDERNYPRKYNERRKNEAFSSKISNKISDSRSEDVSLTSATSVSRHRLTTDGSDSIPEVLKKKMSDRGIIPFEKPSKNTLNSKISSDRMKNLIYDCFPPVVESSSHLDTQEKVRVKEFFTENRNYLTGGDVNYNKNERDGINDVKASEEDSSLRSGFPAQIKDLKNVKLKNSVLEEIATGELTPLDAKRRDYLGGYFDNKKKWNFGSFGESREIFYGRSSVGAIEEITRTSNRSRNDLVAESYSDESRQSVVS